MYRSIRAGIYEINKCVTPTILLIIDKVRDTK